MRTAKQLMSLSKESLVKGIFPSTIDFAPEEADRFLTVLIDLSVLKNNARIVRMAKETKNIRHIGLGTKKLLHPGATFNADNYITEISAQRIQLVAKKARGMVMVDDDALEDNIEGDAFANHLLTDLIAPQAANELEEAYLVGDVVDPATTLNEMVNGWLTICADSYAAGDGDVVAKAQELDAATYDSQYLCAEAASAPYGWRFLFKKMIHALPAKYRRDRTKLGFYVSPGIAEDYRSAIEARATAAGDASIIGGVLPKYGGIDVVTIPLMPETQGAGSDRTSILLTWKDNLIVGLHRALKIETERRAGDEATAFWFSLRTDVQIEDTGGCVVCKNVKVRGE